MLLIPCTFVEPASIGGGVTAAGPKFRKAVFDADTGITYVESATELVTVITANGVQVSFRSTLADWCNKLLAAAADDDEPAFAETGETA